MFLGHKKIFSSTYQLPAVKATGWGLAACATGAIEATAAAALAATSDRIFSRVIRRRRGQHKLEVSNPGAQVAPVTGSRSL